MNFSEDLNFNYSGFRRKPDSKTTCRWLFFVVVLVAKCRGICSRRSQRRIVICCSSQYSRKLLFSRLRTILTVAMVPHIRIDLFRIPTVGLERACDRGSCGGNNLHLKKISPHQPLFHACILYNRENTKMAY